MGTEAAGALLRGLAVAALPASYAVAFVQGWDVCGLKMLGLSCPFCGFSHAAVALVQGQVEAAHAYHPFVIPWLIVAVWLLTWSAVDVVHPRGASARWDPRKRIPPWIWGGLAVTMVGTWIWRMVG